MMEPKSIRGLYAICDNSLCPDHNLYELAKQLLLGGAPILQLRVKGYSTTVRQQRYQAAHAIKKLKTQFYFRLIINDDPELAQEIGADGVHVGADDLPVADCRRLLGPSKLIGYSAHAQDEAEAAEAAGADYVAFGAIYPSPTKGPDHPVQGLGQLRRLVQGLDVPVVAIGGITEDNVGDVINAGASAVAMISALNTAPNVVTATRSMVQRIAAFIPL